MNDPDEADIDAMCAEELGAPVVEEEDQYTGEKPLLKYEEEQLLLDLAFDEED